METSVLATHRARTLLILSAVAITGGVLYDYRMVYAGLAIFFTTLALRGLITLSSIAASRLQVEWIYKPCVEGERLVVEAVFRNKLPFPAGLLEASINYSPYLRLLEGSRAGVFTVPGRGEVRYRLVFKARTGRHKIGPFKIIVRDLFGLFRTPEFMVGSACEVRVKPRASETVVRRLFTYTRTLGLTRTREPGVGVEFYDVREYEPGDELRKIDWKKLASKNILAVKEMEREAFQNIIFVVDGTSTAMKGPYGGTPFEHVARVVSSITRFLSSRGDSVGLVVYSDRGVMSTSGLLKGRRAYAEVLSLLSNTEFAVREGSSDYERAGVLDMVFKRILEMMPRERNAVFWFTTSGAQIYASSLINVVNKISQLGNTVYVVIPVTVAYEVVGLEKTARAIFRLKTFEQVRREIEFARSLKKLGVKTLAIGPEHTPQVVVNIIETLAASWKG